MLDELIDGLQAKYPPNRVAIALGVVLTALLAPAAGVAAAWVQTHFPGLPAFTPAEVLAGAGTVTVAVSTAVVTLAYKFVDGWQKREAAKHAIVARILESPNPIGSAADLALVLGEIQGPVVTGDPSQAGGGAK